MLGKGVAEVLVHRQENEAGTWVDAGHDGYIRRFGIEHRRRFYLSANGQDLRGEDTLLPVRSEEHTSELQSLMRISYAVFCLKKKTKITAKHTYAIQYTKIT